MEASWNAGIRPVATVITDSSDHIRIAVRPMSVAARGDIGNILRRRHGRPPQPRSFRGGAQLRTWESRDFGFDADASPRNDGGTTVYVRHEAGHDDSLASFIALTQRP